MERRIEEFPRQTTDKVRYADTDRQGHVNNIQFAAFLETGRVELLYNPDAPLAGDNAEFVIARLEIDFLGEIQWPGSVAIGIGVKRIGNSSITIEQAVFQDDRCVARAEAVVVHIDSISRQARPLVESTRSRLQEILLV